MELHLLLPFIGTLLLHCTMFWFFSHLTVPASIRYRLVNRHRQCRTFRIRSYFDHYECPSFHFHRLHSIVVPIVELSKKVQEFRFFFLHLNKPSSLVRVRKTKEEEIYDRIQLTLLVQVIVLPFEVFITRLVVLIFPFHECDIFGGFFKNLRSACLFF